MTIIESSIGFEIGRKLEKLLKFKQVGLSNLLPFIYKLFTVCDRLFVLTNTAFFRLFHMCANSNANIKSINEISHIIVGQILAA